MTPVFQANYNEGMKRFPELFGRLKAENYKHIQIAKTADGAYCYISIKDGPQKAVALTDHLGPVKRAHDALNYNPRLQKELAPAVVVGLAPGIILDSVVKTFKDKQKLGHPFRPIYVIVDSLECLYGWLIACDRREILSHPEILFFWHENIGKLVEFCESDINRSHLFIPVSALPDQVSSRLIEPLAKFYIARENQAKIWKAENDKYYNSMSDDELAAVIAGKSGRKPRLLMPTHSASTVIQYSTRDACAMFEKAGWETKIAKINWDFTLWRAAKEVNDFKPDMIIFINYLRSSFMDSIPENLLFVTWIQDTMSHLNQAKVAEEWNKNTVKPHCVTGIPKKRDFLIGYTDIVEPYGYLKERMIQLPMVVNTDIFHPRELTEEQKKKYGCDICFASNRGLPTEEMMKLEFLPPFTNKFLFDEKTCWQIHDELWKHYRAGNTLTSYPSLKNFLTVKVPTFLSCLEKNAPEDQEIAIQRIFWILNDVIYRHVVLEWCDELGLKINLYGKGWDQHPRFKKYAKGIIAHGEELSIAYQSAKFCLHLNSIEGTHQRLNEIRCSGAIPLMRYSPQSKKQEANSWFKVLNEYSMGDLYDGKIKTLDLASQNCIINDLSYELCSFIEYQSSQYHCEEELIISICSYIQTCIENMIYENRFHHFQDIMINGKNDLLEAFKTSGNNEKQKIHNDLQNLCIKNIIQKIYERIDGKHNDAFFRNISQSLNYDFTKLSCILFNAYKNNGNEFIINETEFRNLPIILKFKLCCRMKKDDALKFLKLIPIDELDSFQARYAMVQAGSLSFNAFPLLFTEIAIKAFEETKDQEDLKSFEKLLIRQMGIILMENEGRQINPLIRHLITENLLEKDSYGELAFYCIRSGLYEEGEELFKLIDGKPHSYYTAEAVYLLMKRDFSNALFKIEQADKYHKAPENIYARALIEWYMSGNQKSCIDILNPLLNDETETNWKPYANTLAAIISRYENNFDKAYEYHKKSVTGTASVFAFNYLEYALSLVIQGNYHEALKYAKEGIHACDDGLQSTCLALSKILDEKNAGQSLSSETARLCLHAADKNRMMYMPYRLIFGMKGAISLYKNGNRKEAQDVFESLIEQDYYLKNLKGSNISDIANSDNIKDLGKLFLPTSFYASKKLDYISCILLNL